jgi:Family of unknown function (DUF6232)
MLDTTYYSDKDLVVTGSTITLRGKSYPVGEVQSVRVVRSREGGRRELPYVLITVAVVLLFLLYNLNNLRIDDWANIIPIFLTLDLLFGLGVVGVLLMQLFSRAEGTCLLVLRGTFGTSLALPCKNERDVQPMVDAVRMAILNRQAEPPAQAANPQATSDV